MSDPAPVLRKSIKTIGITTGSGLTITAGLVSATPFAPASREVDTSAAYEDPVSTNVPRPLVNMGEMTLTFLDEGQAFADIASLVVTLAMAVTYHDGTATKVRTVSRDVGVKSVVPGGDVSVDGERKSTVVVTVQPVGGTTLANAGVEAGS